MIARATVAFAILWVSAGAMVAAQSPPQSPPSISDQIVVTANRLQEQVKDIPSLVEVITADQIARSSAHTVDELLRSIAGFSMLRQGSSLAGNASVRSTSFRGLAATASRTLVMVDGVPINNPVTSIVNWPAISLDNVERIEIVKNGGSGVWGNLAMGGVINVIMKSGRPSEPVSSASVQGGNFGTAEFHGAVRRVAGPIGLSASIGYLTTDGYMTIPDNQATVVDRPVANTVKTFDTTVGYHGQRAGTWSVSGTLFSEAMSDSTILAHSGTGAGSLRASGEIVRSDGSRWQITSFLMRQLFHSYTVSVAADRLSATPSTNQYAVPGDAAGVGVQWSKPLARHHLLSFGADVEWTRALMNEDSSYSVPTSRFTRRRNAAGQQAFGGLFFEDVYQIASRWRVVGAARVDRWQTISGSRLETDTVTGNVLRDDVYSPHREIAFDPSLGTLFRASSRLSLRGTINRGLRAPTASELYRPFRSRGNTITESNAQLAPERSTGVEAGADATLGSSTVARVTAFSSWISNPVIPTTIGTTGSTSKTIAPCGLVSANGVCRQLKNAGQLRTAGIELELDYRPRPAFSASINYMYDRSVVTAAPGEPQLVGKFNRQAPVHQATIQASYEDRRVARVSALVRLVGQRFEDDINTLPIARFASLDLMITRGVSAKLEAYLGVQNVTDRANELTHTADGIYTVVGPRQINAGLRFTF